MKAVFLDRGDGTMMRRPPALSDPAGVALIPGVVEALRRLHAAGFSLIFVTNQSGIGRGLVTPEQSDAVHRRTLELLIKVQVASSCIMSAPWDAPVP